MERQGDEKGPRRASRRWLTWLGAGVAGALLAGGAVIGVAATVAGSSREPSPATVAAAATASAPTGPGGTIIFQVTGEGFFRADAGDLSTAPVTTYWQAPAAGGFAVSPNERWYAMVDDDGAGMRLVVGAGPSNSLPRPLARLAVPGDPVLIVGKGEAASVGGIPLVLAWSPDSARLAFGTVKTPYALSIATLDAAGAWQVTEYAITGGYVGELAWAPDGKTLAISTYTSDRKNHTVLLHDGATVRRLSDGCHITWSPDSRFVAVHRDPGAEAGASILAIDGSARLTLSMKPQAFPFAWQP